MTALVHSRIVYDTTPLGELPRHLQKRDRIGECREALKADRETAVRALLTLYGLQTPEEQAGLHTGELNGCGFTRYDADLLSSFARQVKADGNKCRAG